MEKIRRKFPVCSGREAAMTRDVHITVTGVSLDESGQETATELTTRGQYFEKDDSRFLLYEEQDPDSGAVVRSTLKIKNHTVELSKSGAVRSRMIFETGKTHRTSYDTPYGSLLLDICTDDLKSAWSDNTGSVQLAYRLLTEDALLSRNRLFIKIKSFS